MLNDNRTERVEEVRTSIKAAFNKTGSLHAQATDNAYEIDPDEEIVDNPNAPYPGADMMPATMGSERIV